MWLRDLVQEGRDLGLSGFLFRSLWELKLRSGWIASFESRRIATDVRADDRWYERVPFASPVDVGSWMSNHLAAAAVDALRSDALASLRGDIRAFGGRSRAAFGQPVDWHRHPVTRRRWPDAAHWSRALRARGAGDIKFTWEVARFPHAWWLARIAATQPELGAQCAKGLAQQIAQFRAANPYGRGVHWSSGLEIALRMMSWSFAGGVFGRLALWDEPTLAGVAAGLLESAAHIEKYFSFARKSVDNDHLIAEALALLIASVLFPEADRAAIWRKTSERVLTEEATRQIGGDGGYFMYSHHYHRSVLQYYLWASRFVSDSGGAAPLEWTAALDRSLEFLTAHMNPGDGRVPNSGSNDGGLPALLTTCDYSDFRPVLQAIGIMTRDRRIFSQGPWDEEALWLAGAGALDAPVQPAQFRSQAFRQSGYYVLRADDPSTFVSFRCGAVRSRFPQIDMLHVDLWWNGQNMLVDGGTYQYNGPREWHEFFYRTASHNTLMIDDVDQMRHHRQFRVLYWTDAKLRAFVDTPSFAYVSGEHYGYRRLPGRCTHRRSVLLLKTGLCIVYDVATGERRHDLRLQWQAGDFPFSFDQEMSTMTLHARDGEFRVAVRDLHGESVAAAVKAGATDPIQGWVARSYGEKIAAPSLVAHSVSALPAGFVTVLAAGTPSIDVEDGRWRVAAAGSVVEFTAGPDHVQLDDVVVSEQP